MQPSASRPARCARSCCWGNLITFTQDVDSAIGASGRAAFALSYMWEKATGGRQTLRLDSASYPGGSDLDYVYDSSFLGSIVHDPASRLQYLEVGATQVALYYYHGASDLTWTNLLEPTLQNQAGTSSGYPNWDNFNRPIATKWFKSVGGGTNFYHIDVNWDKSGSIVGVVDNLRKSGIGGTRRFDVQYTNDNLGRLLRAQEGSLSGTTLSSPSRDEQWTDGTNSKLSPTGNWLYRRLDLDGDGVFTDLGDENQSSDATFNVANELTARTFARGIGSGTTSTTHTYAYDAVGNQTDDGRDYTYKYDVWGRLKEIKTRGGSPVLKSEFRYNGLGYRIGWHYDTDLDSDVDGSDVWFYWMHDERWRQIATFRGSDSDPKERFVYHAAGLDGLGGSSYLDAMILRDRDGDDKTWLDESDGDLEERHYLCQNWRNDTALVATDAGALVENAKFSGYGNTFNCPAGDTDSNGTWDSTDAAAITGSYDVNKDINMDGSVGAGDLTAADAVTGGYHTEGRGVLSAEEVFIRKGYAGYEVEPILTGGDQLAFLHHVRDRILNSYSGRWHSRDKKHRGSDTFYSYADNIPTARIDPDGMAPIPSYPVTFAPHSHKLSGQPTPSGVIQKAVWFMEISTDAYKNCHGVGWVIQEKSWSGSKYDCNGGQLIDYSVAYGTIYEAFPVPTNVNGPDGESSRSWRSTANRVGWDSSNMYTDGHEKTGTASALGAISITSRALFFCDRDLRHQPGNENPNNWEPGHNDPQSIRPPLDPPGNNLPCGENGYPTCTANRPSWWPATGGGTNFTHLSGWGCGNPTPTPVVLRGWYHSDAGPTKPGEEHREVFDPW